MGLKSTNKNEEEKQKITDQMERRQNLQRHWIEMLQKYAQKINSNY